MDKNLRSHLLTAAIAAVVSLVFSNAVVLNSQDDVLEEIIVTGQVLFDDWAGTRMIGRDDGTCPQGYEIDGLFAGRYVVGTPSGGASSAVSGLPLTNQEVRRGGTSHNAPVLSALSATYTRPTLNNINVSYTRPSASFSGNTHSHTVYDTVSISNAHTHRQDIAEWDGTINVVADSGNSGRRVPYGISIDEATSSTSGGTVTERRLIAGGLGTRNSTVSGSVSLSGGSVTVSGGTLSGGSVTVQGSIAGGAAVDQLQPAPYVQIPICISVLTE